MHKLEDEQSLQKEKMQTGNKIQIVSKQSNNLQKNMVGTNKKRLQYDQQRGSQFKSFEYSMKDSQSLHSFFSSQKIEEYESIKNNSMRVEESQSLKIDLISSLEKGLIFNMKQSQSNLEENEFRKNAEHKRSEEIFQCEVIKNFLGDDQYDNNLMNLQNENNHNNNDAKNQCQVKTCNERKSYISYLHEAVDKNHLESPNKNIQIISSSQDLSEQSPIKLMPFQNNSNTTLLQINQNQQQLKNQLRNSQFKIKSNQVLRCSNANQFKYDNTTQQKIDMPQNLHIIHQNKLNLQENRGNKQQQLHIGKQIQVQIIKNKQSAQNSNKKPQKLQVRRIPSQLYSSYDQLNLTVQGKLNSSKSKNNLNSPIKLKQKSNRMQNERQQKQKIENNQIKTTFSMKVNFDQQLLASLPVIQGYCQVKSEKFHPIQTKFIIYKNFIVFQACKKLCISFINKIKFVQKNEGQFFIKINFKSLEIQEKEEIFIISLINKDPEMYFYQLYQIYSQIIIRKVLLMNIIINEFNQKKQVLSPRRSPLNSFSNFHINQQLTFAHKFPQTTQLSSQVHQNLYQSQLFKKSSFFGNWQKKYLTLSAVTGLQIYNSLEYRKQKHKLSAQLNKTSEIWTRFELIYGYLVIKMWQNKLQKIQIGIPLCDFTNRQNRQNWLYGFCRYILGKNIFTAKDLEKQQKLVIV